MTLNKTHLLESSVIKRLVILHEQFVIVPSTIRTFGLDLQSEDTPLSFLCWIQKFHMNQKLDVAIAKMPSRPVVSITCGI